MDDRQEPPEPWASAFIAAGLTTRDRPTYRAAARAVSLAEGRSMAPETVRRIVNGIGKPRPENVAALARALGTDVLTVSEWAGQVRSLRQPYAAPPEGDLMSERQRRAIDELIRLLAAVGVTKEDEDAERSTQKNVTPIGRARSAPTRRAAARKEAPPEAAKAAPRKARKQPPSTGAQPAKPKPRRTRGFAGGDSSPDYHIGPGDTP